MRDPHSYESPIHGMSDETFQNIMDEEFAKDEDEEKIAAEENLLNEHLACVKEEA